MTNLARTWVALGCLGALIGARDARALSWPDVSERVERDLSASDAGTRRAAARSLASIGPARGTALALQAMNDPDEDVRLAAASAAIRFRAAGATEIASSWLNGADVRLRREACEVARALPSANVVALLARSLGDPDPEVRAAAADALGHSPSPDAAPPLLGRLDDTTPAVRVAIVAALARLGDARAVVPLVGKVEDSAADVRQAVVRALGDLGDTRASAALVLALRDQSADVRREALVALARLRATDAVDAIVPFLSDRIASLRGAALDALGHIASPDALRAMIAALGKGDDASATLGPTPVRDAFVVAGDAAIAPLRALLSAAPTPDAAIGAAWVLGELHARGEGPTLVAAMRRGTLPVAAALHALAGAGTGADIPIVLEFIDDPSPPVRAEALTAALALLDPHQPDGRAVEPLAAAIRDARLSTPERARVARALGRTGAPRAAALLGQLARAEDPTVRGAAIDALGTLGSADADGPLLEALQSRDAEVRLRAAVALSQAGAAHARDALLADLDGTDEVDRAAILTALAGILSRAPDDAAVAKLSRSLDLAAGPDRDGILAALGAAPGTAAVAALQAAARSGVALDRRAAVQMSAAHSAIVDPAGAAGALALARSSLDDVDEGVRAQAAWALGTLGNDDDVSRLMATAGASGSSDASTNAAAAVARIAGRARAAGVALRALCSLAGSASAPVRANAWAGVALAHARCGDGSPERRALLDDPSEAVRAAAARVLELRADPEDIRALGRCSRTEPAAAVALRCAHAPAPVARTRATLVYVVPGADDKPVPGASYDLALADGTIHAGTADRRGAVFDPVAPEGPLRLVGPDSLR